MQNMTRSPDVVDRAYQGPFTDEREFELKVVSDGGARVVRACGIRSKPDDII